MIHSVFVKGLQYAGSAHYGSVLKRRYLYQLSLLLFVCVLIISYRRMIFLSRANV